MGPKGMDKMVVGPDGAREPGSSESLPGSWYYDLAFFCLALRTLTSWGFYIKYKKEAKGLTRRMGAEVSQDDCYDIS